MSMIGLYLALLLLVIAVVLFIISSRQRRQAGLPDGRIIYVDSSQWGKVQKPLYDPEIRLTGKPDYLVRQAGQVIPVEVKSSHAPQVPYDAHIYQLAAYCLLVEREYTSRPAYGIIHYANKSFAVDYTPQLEEAVRATIRQMQSQPSSSSTDRSHREAQRCQHCGYAYVCDQSLRI
jgi:CRISPR-associated exonuclease Cas4